MNLHPEPKVGLVRAVLQHRFAVGDAREGTWKAHAFDLLEQLAHEGMMGKGRAKEGERGDHVSRSARGS